MPNSDPHNVDFSRHIASVVYDSQRGGAVIRINPTYVGDIMGRTRPYKRFPYHMKPVLEKVADYVRVEMIPRTFRQEGPGWKKLAKRTRRERAAQGYGPSHPILIRTRDLFKELTDKAHPKHIEVIKTGKYSRVEIGGSSEKFIRNQSGNWEYHIPSRPMIPGTEKLPLPDRDRIAIKDIINKSVRQEMNSRG